MAGRTDGNRAVKLWHAILALITLSFGVAIWSRLVQDKSVPGTITAGANGLTNIFRGVFNG